MFKSFSFLKKKTHKLSMKNKTMVNTHRIVLCFVTPKLVMYFNLEHFISLNIYAFSNKNEIR